MPAEFEELKLQVTFQDNASAQLKALVGDVEKLGNFSKQASGGFKEATDSAGKFTGELTKIAGAFGLAGAASLLTTRSFSGFTDQLGRTNNELNNFSRQMINLENASRVAGVLPDQFKNIAEQLEELGYTASEAESTLTSFFRTVDEASRAGTAQFNRIWRESWNPELTLNRIKQMRDMIARGEGAKALADAAKEGRAIFEREMAAGHGRAEATRQMSSWLETVGLDPKAMNITDLSDIIGDPDKWARRIAAAKAFNTEFVKFDRITREIGSEVKFALMPAFEDLNKLLDENKDMFKGEETTKFINDIRGLISDLTGLMRDINNLRKGGDEGKGAATSIFGRFGKQPLGSSFDWLNMTPEEAWKSFTARPKESAVQRWWRGSTDLEPRQHGGSVETGRSYLVGERGPEMFVPRNAGTIVASNAMSGDDVSTVATMRENRELMEEGNEQKSELAINLKQINDELEQFGLWRMGTGARGGAGGRGGGAGAGVPGGAGPHGVPGPGAHPAAGPGAIPGPYGQPMPPWGRTVTGPESYGGGAGRGVAGDVPGLPGGPSGRPLTPDERRAAAGGGGASGVPNVDGMTESERNQLGLITQYESGDRNVPNYINDRTHTAQGYYQITNTNWRNIAPGLGIKAPNAMSATKEEQTRVALALLRGKGGIGNWARYNPRLRRALQSGELPRQARIKPPQTLPPAQSQNPAAAPTAGAGAVTHQGTGGAVPESLRQQMEYAGLAAGVRTNIAHGMEPGHARHSASAPSGDVDFYDPVTNRKLDVRNPEDQAKMAAYVEAAAAAGATGIGFGKDGSYMGFSRMHVGGGTPAVWGAGGKGANAPDWLRMAYERGVKRRMDKQQVAKEITRLREQQKTQIASPIKSEVPAILQPRQGLDRSGFDRAEGSKIYHTVSGAGKIDVNVKNSAGARSTPIAGPFKKIPMTSQRQNMPAASGPPEPVAADHDAGKDG